MKGLTIVFALLATGCAMKPHSLVPHLAMSASIGCEAADTATTMYAIGKGVAREANPYLAPVQDFPLAFVARKYAVAGATNTGFWVMEKKHPWLATIGYASNAVLKCYVATRNDRIGRGAR